MLKWTACLLCLAILSGTACALAEPLKKGDKGDEVKALQARLFEHNYLDGGIDGDFGSNTNVAVKQVQADAGLEETGIADDATLAALETHYAEFKPAKGAKIQLYWVEYDMDSHILSIRIKNMGTNRITGFTFRLSQCDAKKNRLGSFYGDEDVNGSKKITRYSTEHTVTETLESGETTVVRMKLEEGREDTFSDGTPHRMVFLEKGEVARVTLTAFTTEDDAGKSKSNKVSSGNDQTCAFRTLP